MFSVPLLLFSLYYKNCLPIYKVYQAIIELIQCDLFVRNQQNSNRLTSSISFLKVKKITFFKLAWKPMASKKLTLELCHLLTF